MNKRHNGTDAGSDRYILLLVFFINNEMPVKIHAPGKAYYFCLLLFEATFTSFFKDKKSQNSRY